MKLSGLEPVNIGCGTTPDHIGAIHQAVAPLATRAVQAGPFYREAA